MTKQININSPFYQKALQSITCGQSENFCLVSVFAAINLRHEICQAQAWKLRLLSLNIFLITFHSLSLSLCTIKLYYTNAASRNITDKVCRTFCTINDAWNRKWKISVCISLLMPHANELCTVWRVKDDIQTEDNDDEYEHKMTHLFLAFNVAKEV